MTDAHVEGAESAFAPVVILAKREVFDALEACANAERALLRCGRATEAAAIASLFEMLEDRVVLEHLAPEPSGRGPAGSCDGSPYFDGSAGSNSRDSEFTQ